MNVKVFRYLSAFIVAGYVIYADYSILQGVTWGVAKVLFPGVGRYPVYAFVRYLFYLTGAFVVFIYVAYFIFYLYFKENEGKEPYPQFFPRVSIVVPAHNEAMNVERLIESIYYQDYPFQCYEIIMVDDGSQDRTGEIAARYGVKVIKHERNMGKAKSLEDGIRAAKGDVVITMDADSYFGDGSSLRNIIENLFSRPFVGISTGIIRISPRSGRLIERFQEVEFLHSFEVGRRVQNYLGWLLVIPGAFSAFRGYFIRSLPSVPKDTLAEDFDLAMIAYRAGLDSSFEANAKVYTDPELEWERLYRQRIRWYYGGLQVLSKHQDMIMNPKYRDRGVFLFIHMILMEYVLSLVQIFGIVAFPAILVLQNLLGMRVLDVVLPTGVMLVLFFVVLLLQYLPGIIVTTLTMAIEMGSRKALRYLPVTVLYYLVYNPLLSVAKVDAVLRFLRGVVQEW